MCFLMRPRHSPILHSQRFRPRRERLVGGEQHAQGRRSSAGADPHRTLRSPENRFESPANDPNTVLRVTTPPPALEEIRRRLPELMVRDGDHLRRRLDRARSMKSETDRVDALARIIRDLEAAEARVVARRVALPVVRYPEGLPVVERKDEILETIRQHQVVILAGETGSGKSTQLPKICLELGRGVRGLIGHTQPRRLAARTVAERIADELETELGQTVGYTVRFTDRVGGRTLVKLMSDGILLNGLPRDRTLSRYDTLIVDEAHERSLNIDFILGYLRQLLPRRPDLKVIVTSATIDTERFSRHFGNAPIVEVSGRTYPVELRYRPLVDDEREAERDQTQAICDAVRELEREATGDVLVFLSGEREIRDTAEAITALRLRETEVLPLYARLSAAEQHRIFQPHPGRRIVLATNVAETSLTVPGVRYVVDAGTARVSRYSRRTKVQRLPIEAVSQAAANQRAGRCGRVAPGICIRLYAEDDFDSRPEFTEPEILRTNLASVILQMTSIGLGDIGAFPFVDPPDPRNITDGMVLLEELGALHPGEPDPRKRLTPLGRRLAAIPLDPRLARMVIEAQANGCVREVMVITAALSIQDPRERPAGKQPAADEFHRRFANPDSDFLSYLNLWDYLRQRQQELSSNQFRRMCRTEYLNYLRVREWQDIYSQVRQVCSGLGLRINHEAADPDAVHLALLSGLLSQIGMRVEEKQEYAGARNARFSIQPGSALFKKPPKWVMAAELVETTRLWARVVARIQPDWAERAGAHLVKRTYSEPQWERKRAGVTALEKVTLHGLPIVTSRKVDFGRIDPRQSRDLFLGHALVEGDWDTHHEFVATNARTVEKVRTLEDRARRRDILVGENALFDFFDERVPPDVVSGRHFDSWWKKARRDDPTLLDFRIRMLVHPDASDVDLASFPDSWRIGDLELPLTYEFDPGAEADGVTVHVPLQVLNRIGGWSGFDWQVPGHRRELVTALIRSLPKTLRRHFVPVPDYVSAFLADATPSDGPLLDALATRLTRMTGERVTVDDFDVPRLPDHLRMAFRIEDPNGRRVAFGRDLEAIRARLHGHLQAAITRAVGPTVERTDIRTWDFGELPQFLDATSAGHTVRAYPALIDEGDSASIRLFGTVAEQTAARAGGIRRLLILTLPPPAAAVKRLMTKETKLSVALHRHGHADALIDECIGVALDALVAASGGAVWDAESFERLVESVRPDVVDRSLQVVVAAGRILRARHGIESRLVGITATPLLPARLDVRRQLARLVPPSFVTSSGADRLGDVERYLRAIEHRLDRLAGDAARDADRMRRVRSLEEHFERTPSASTDVGWMLEELRVSLFAQSLGTPTRVSEERVRRAIDGVA